MPKYINIAGVCTTKYKLCSMDMIVGFIKVNLTAVQVSDNVIYFTLVTMVIPA